MGRKTKEELEVIKKQENVDRIWSWSRINCFHTSTYEYFIKYIKCIPEDRQDCIYTTTGTIAHDILEKLYTNKIEYKEMIDQFEDAWLVAYDISKLKFDRNNEESNNKIGQKYYENLKHFFNNHVVLKHKPIIEQFVKFRIGNNLFAGYIDCCFKDDNEIYNIIDFKTSSIYSGEKKENECGQLVCYAIALNQMGIDYKKIHIAWNFLKYCTVQYNQADGKVKLRDIERCKLGESLQSNCRMWLKKLGYENEADNYLKKLLDTNSIKCLPKDVQEKYKISDCYVYVPLTDKLINKWENEIIATIEDIKFREKEWNETHNEKLWWDTEESINANSYYFSTLCGYSKNIHKPYAQYLEKIEQEKNGFNLFPNIGSKVETNKSVCKNNEIDLSWLDNI